MKISVIIPVYNVEKYLSQCLESILNQKFNEYEVIAINDGSTDNSKQILMEYEKKYKNLIVINRENQGVSACRNYGLEIAKGKYILFLDSDDYVEPGLLKIIYSKAIEKDYDLVTWGFNFVNENSEFLGKQSIGRVKKKDDIIEKDWPVVWNKLFKKTIIKKSGINFPKGLWHQDLATIPFYIMECNSYFYIKKSLINYRVERKGNITHSFNSKSYDIFKVFEVLKERVRVYPEYKEKIDFLIYYHGKASMRKWRKISTDSEELNKIEISMKNYLSENKVANLKNRWHCTYLLINKLPSRVLRTINIKLKRCRKEENS